MKQLLNLSSLIHRLLNCQYHGEFLIKFKLLFIVSGILHLHVSLSLWQNCCNQAARSCSQRHINLRFTSVKKNCYKTKWDIIITICKMLDWLYFINFRGNSLATKPYLTFVWHKLCYSWVKLVLLFQPLMWWFRFYRYQVYTWQCQRAVDRHLLSKRIIRI